MSKLPNSKSHNEILTLRISKKLKDKLIKFATSKYGGSASAAIRALIESESKRY